MPIDKDVDSALRKKTNIEEPKTETKQLTGIGVKKKAKITSIYLAEDLHEELRKRSFIHRVTVTSIIERALRDYLENHPY